jgi:hypothetical protein
MKRFLKKAALLGFCCLVTIPAFSQNTAKVATKKVPPSGGTSLSADQSKMLCKAWKLDTLSQFGVEKKASAKEANDGITFVADGNLFFTQEGAAATGTWSYAGGRINTVTKNPDNKISFKIISLADNRVVLEYQTPDLVRIRYTYSPKK